MKQVRNLYSELMRAVGEVEGTPDSRFQHWAKRVDSVDTSRANGYAFDGDFISEGTVEVEIQPTVFITKTVRGSRKYQTATYNVVVMDADGNLSVNEDIHTTDANRGWALRIRDQVAELVISLSDAPEQSVTVELSGEALAMLQRLRGNANFTDTEIIAAALNVYEMHLNQI